MRHPKPATATAEAEQAIPHALPCPAQNSRWQTYASFWLQSVSDQYPVLGSMDAQDEPAGAPLAQFE